jgi:hypothetical protein
MSRTVSAIFDGEVFRPTEPLDLPADAEYRLTIDEHPANGTDEWEPSGEPGVFDDILALAHDLDLPSDYAAQIDHYRFGHPKR